MYYLLIGFIIIILLVFLSKNKNIENFKNSLCNYPCTINRYYYDYSLSDVKFNDKCKLKGLIDEYDNPSYDICYEGFYIPSIFNVAFYNDYPLVNRSLFQYPKH